MKKSLIPLLSLGLAVGCGGEMPTGTDGPSADFAVAGGSGCATPQFNAVVTFQAFATFGGLITGDLEGTVTFVFAPDSDTFAG